MLFVEDNRVYPNAGVDMPQRRTSHDASCLIYVGLILVWKINISKTLV